MDESIVRNAHARPDSGGHTIWYFCARNRVLISGEKTILLTRTESQIISLLLSSKDCPISNHQIAVGINKCPDSYNGLLMSMSRLKRKFSTSSNGDTLFKSVRNRGYRLTQALRPLPYFSEATVSLKPAPLPTN